MKYYFIMLFISTSCLTAAEYNLKWQFQPDMSLNGIRQGTIQIYKNNKLVSSREDKYIINMTAVSIEKTTVSLRGRFKVLSRQKGKAFLLIDTFNSHFKIKEYGQYVVPKDVVMPNERSIPSFPDEPVSLGDSWIAPVQVFFHEYSTKFLMETDVEYTFLGLIELNGKKYAKIGVFYLINEDIRKMLPKNTTDTPMLFWGRVYSVFFWNIEKNVPFSQNEDYHLITIYQDGNTIEYKMNTKTVYDVSFPLQKNEINKMTSELKKSLKGVKDAGVYTASDGIHIKLGDVYFDFDSSKLKRDGKNILKKITPFLEKYKKYELSIEGHTDNIGNAKYNKSLSEKRARSVLNYLLSTFSGNHGKIYYHGFGAEKPVSKNTAEAGRQKNRRVEIIIKQSGE